MGLSAEQIYIGWEIASGIALAIMTIVAAALDRGRSSSARLCFLRRFQAACAHLN